MKDVSHEVFMTEGNEANRYDSRLEIKQEELHIMDVCCQEKDFQDDLDTSPSDQFDLSHGQNSTFPNSPLTITTKPAHHLLTKLIPTAKLCSIQTICKIAYLFLESLKLLLVKLDR